MADYSRQLFEMFSAPGEAIQGNRDRAEGTRRYNESAARQMFNDEQAQKNNDRDFNFRGERASVGDSQWERGFGADQSYRNRSLALQESNREIKAPQLGEFFDDNGQPYKAQWNGQSWDRVGGSKAPSNGMTIETLPDGTTRVIQGGAAKPLPAEVGARIGLGNQFLDNDLPQIRKDIAGGALGGNGALGNIKASAEMAAGVGTPGQINRRVQTGLDALRRNLTGAGMSASEANDYVQRYVPGSADSMETINSKLTGLESDLRAVADGASAGRVAPASASQQGQQRPTQGDNGGGDVLNKARAAIAAGADPRAVAERLRRVGVDPSGL